MQAFASPPLRRGSAGSRGGPPLAPPRLVKSPDDVAFPGLTVAGGDGRTPGSGASGSGRWTRARLVGLRGLTAGAWEVTASELNRKLGRKQQFVQEETMASEKNLGPKGPCSSPSLSPLWRSGFLRCPLIQIPSSGHVTLAFLRFCLEEERLTSEVTPLRAVRAPRPDREPCAPLHSSFSLKSVPYRKSHLCTRVTG